MLAPAIPPYFYFHCLQKKKIFNFEVDMWPSVTGVLLLKYRISLYCTKEDSISATPLQIFFQQENAK